MRRYSKCRWKDAAKVRSKGSEQERERRRERERERERERLSRVRKYVSKASSTKRSILG